MSRFRIGEIVECVKRDWSDNDWLHTMPVHLIGLPRRGECYTVAETRTFQRAEPVQMYSRAAAPPPETIEVVWLREIPGPPFSADGFAPAEMEM